jgi:hypothetical protein
VPKIEERWGTRGYFAAVMIRTKHHYAVPQKKLDIEPTKKNKLPITKIDAARRQLETAITLWFSEGDPVSIHTLVMAAHEILRTFNKLRAGPSMLTDGSEHIRPEYQQAYEELVVRSYQFFKHGGKDPENTEWFNPESNTPMILDSVEAYFRIAGKRPPILQVFRTYVLVHKPDLFVGLPDMQLHSDWIKWSKSKFFFEILPLATIDVGGATRLSSAGRAR